MTHRTRPTRTPLVLGFAALLLLHAAQTSAPAAQTQAPAFGDPVNMQWLLHALRVQRLGEAELVRQVEGRSSSFFPTAEEEKELRAAGATTRLLEAVRKSFRQGPVTVVGAPPPGGGGSGGSGEPVDYTLPFKQSEVTRRAVITDRPEAEFTEKARQNDVEGVVRLRVVLGASGKVSDINVIKGLPDGLTEKCVAAAKKIRFHPAEKDGRKVSQYVVIEYAFVGPYWNETDVDERAVILEMPAPEYTEEARRHHTRGKVVLKITLTSFGSVMVDSVERGLPHGLTEKAVEAAERIKFNPAKTGGRPVSQRATAEYPFAP